MIQFTIRQSYKHVDSLSFIIAYFNLQFHFSIIHHLLMGIHHLLMDLHTLTGIKSVFNGVTLCAELQDFAA